VNYYPFRSNSDFFYLSGFEEPDAAFILLPEGEKKFIMFVQPKNAFSSQWFGDVPGVEGAMVTFGADTAYALDQFENVLRQHLFRKQRVYFDIRNEELNTTVQALISQLRGRGPKEMIDVLQYTHEMRIIKDSQEIELIRKAVEIVCEAHQEAMKAIEPGMYEYEIASIFSYVFEKNGSLDKAFESIVASGPNATIFHYSQVKRQTQDGDLIMMDMGAEFNNYASDVTRVLPVNGKFTKKQKDVYEIVLDMLDVIVEHMIPGNKWFDCMAKSESIAKEGLFRLGLITDRDTEWQHLLYYYAYAGHAMGLDVHDVGDYGSYRDGGRVLEPGMVFAVEPMIYIGDNLVESFRLHVTRRYRIPEETVDAFLKEIEPAFNRYNHVAARVEDDILITEDGNENLSAHLPKTVKDIEKMMAERSYLNLN
jgi:Xaa-Pro aminopeptidase